MRKSTLLLATAATALALVVSPPATAGETHFQHYSGVPLTTFAFRTQVTAGTELAPVLEYHPGEGMYIDCHSGAHGGVILRLTFTFQGGFAIVDNPTDGQRARIIPLGPTNDFFVLSTLAEPDDPTMVGPQIRVQTDAFGYARHNIEIIGPPHWASIELLSIGDPIGEDSVCMVQGRATLVGHLSR